MTDTPRGAAEILGFAATVTDDPAVARHLVDQALERAGAASSSAEWAETARVWVARAALSEDHTLGRPVAADVDVPAAGGDGGVDDLPARLSRSSRLQRVVAALFWGEHLDAATVARVVGSTEPDITTYLAGVRSRLGIDGPSGAAALRRLLRDRAAAVVAAVGESRDVELDALRDRLAGTGAELARAREAAEQAALRVEQAVVTAEARAARETAEAEQRHAAELAEAEQRHAAELAEAAETHRLELAAIDRARADDATRAEQLAAELAAARADAAEAHRAAEAHLAQELEAREDRHRGALVDAGRTAAQLQESLAQARAEVEAAQAELLAAQAEVEAAHAETASLSTDPAGTDQLRTDEVETDQNETVGGETGQNETVAGETDQNGTVAVETDQNGTVGVETDQIRTEQDRTDQVDPDGPDLVDTDLVDTEVVEPDPAVRATVRPSEQEIADEVDAMFRLSVRTPPPYPSLKVVRPLIVLTAVLGLNYLIWRWIFSIHWSAWWIAVPLVVAETYSLLDSMIFGFTMWRLKRRPDPGPPPEDATVDVFITTYNEPLDLVMKTARAAQRITFPHTLWILDDGNRAELKELAGSEGIGVISRSSDWIDMPRHAKAGNLNNALMVTQGEFIVILDADQVPAPELLDRTLGYFREEKMAVVQTPQFFVNVPKSDPLGSQAPLFYGPIQQGKDGWNSAFFCGSNAVLRREALLQMGIRRYVHELQVRIDDALNTSEKVIRRARAKIPADQPAVADALRSVLEAARECRAELAGKEPLADATARFQRRVHEAARRVVEQDLAESRADLSELFELVDEQIAEVTSTDVQSEALDRLARRDWSPLGAIETVAALIAVVDVDREDEAQPIMPMSTISVTEDMATCMRMHSMGWKSAYHDEVLAVGLAPEDLGTMLTQRLRWAQGTIQVMLRENPLRQKGLSFPQKIMYLGTMWSYLSGFAALAYIAAPVIYLVFGVLPVDALSVSFFARLIPFLIVNQLLFFVIGRGRSTWRGQQYSLALFPVWIKAVTSAVSNVAFGRSLTFAVTPKERVHVTKLPWRLVRPQLIAMALLVVAAAIGIVRLAAGQATVLGTSINLVWVAFDLVLFSAVIRALFYKGFQPAPATTVPESTHQPHPAATLQEVTR